MRSWSEIVERHRPSMLAVVMGALLVACVAVAGWLVVSRGGSDQAGADVLGVIRQRGLVAWWSNESISDWYLCQGPDGQPVGWFVVSRAPNGKEYRGRRLQQIGADLTGESWVLDRQGVTGQYLGEARKLLRRRGLRLPLERLVGSTSVALSDGQAQVVRQGPGPGRPKATGPVPANYIPKGMSDLAYFLASLGDRRATFSILEDDHAVVGEDLHFSRVTAVPRGKGKVLLEIRSRAGVERRVVEFDADGRVGAGQNLTTGVSFERSTYDKVKKIFPLVELFVRREAESAPE